ncbi:transporter [Anaeromyxobacter oryzisoli]|uniref:transporter n=1 Tax=Anaeromyxobacter oryzisoli TaxID=2925408 RepID=UPI001F563121|nr:transporter [Anaeromyxobacter sp. SG63]
MNAARPSGSGGRAALRGVRGALAAGAVALLLGPPTAYGSCCIFEDPLLAIGDVAARSGALRLAVETETLSSTAAMQSGDGMAAGMAMVEHVRQATVRTVVVYSPVERLNLVAALPLVRREWRLTGDGMNDERVVLTGLGDVDLGARLAVWRRVEFVQDPERIAVTRVQALALSAGTSLPTGEDDARRDGLRLEEHAQIGTGGWGPYAGLLYQLSREPWAFAVSATARLRTPNAFGYRFGNAVLAGLDVQHDLFTRLSIGVGADVRWAAQDLLSGATVSNTGGFIGSGTASMSVGLAPGLQARVRAVVPIFQRLEGDQRAGAAFFASVSWNPS